MQSIFTKEALDTLLKKKNTIPEEVYVSNDELNEALKAAILLGQPLLLTGEPGTGKTTLGNRLARELNELTEGEFNAKPILFSTKSVSVASDLFYTYDAISHFQQANLKQDFNPIVPEAPVKSSADYISLQALGLAILAGNHNELEAYPALVHQLPNPHTGRTPSSFVVIIDEIDKAPRDFPNDILYEIENLSFTIKEIGHQRFTKNNDARILIILTSNSEKSLPEAFLRRCLFHHIDFPSADLLKDIIRAHHVSYAIGEPVSEAFLTSSISLFEQIREICKDKKPSTAELIAWTKYLAHNNYDFAISNPELLRTSLSIVVKGNYDRKLILDSGIIN